MTLVIGTLALAGGTEGLAGTGACPNRSGVSAQRKGVVPSADAGKEVDPLVSGDINRPNIDN
jgi:hypothetical protein